jgi:hypothetical protein
LASFYQKMTGCTSGFYIFEDYEIRTGKQSQAEYLFSATLLDGFIFIWNCKKLR